MRVTASHREGAPVKADTATRRYVGYALERDVVHRDHKRGVAYRRHHETRRVDHVGIDAHARAPEAVPGLVPNAPVRWPEIDPGNLARHARRTSTGRERDGLHSGCRQRPQERMRVAPDTPRNRLQELARVARDLQRPAVGGGHDEVSASRR